MCNILSYGSHADEDSIVLALACRYQLLGGVGCLHLYGVPIGVLCNINLT